MTVKRSQYITHGQRIFVTAILLVVFVFSCRGLVFGTIGADIVEGAHMQGMSHGTCCALSDSGASAFTHAQLQAALPGITIFFFVVLAAASFVALVSMLRPLASYYHYTRRNLGSTRLFCYYASLFSKGILHPKTF